MEKWNEALCEGHNTNTPYVVFKESSLSPQPHQDFSLGIGYSNQQPAPPPNDTPSLPRISEQPRTATMSETAHHSNGENLFIFSIALTILCILCGGWFALLCTIPAIVMANRAQVENKSGNEKTAQKKRKCAICFIAMSVFTYIYMMVAAFVVIRSAIAPALKPLSFRDVQVLCVDNFLAARYDGSGGVYVAGAEPSGNIHTSRGDCNGLPQGWQRIFQFDTRGRSSVSVNISGTALGRTCTGNFTTGTTAVYQEVFTPCAWQEYGAQFPIVTTIVSVT